MAEPIASATVSESKSVAPQISSLNDFLKHYSPAHIEPARDTLDGRWHIELASRLPEFDTRTARAYAATDLLYSQKKLYALVCHPGTYQRHRLIATLKVLRHPNLITLLAAGAVELSQPSEERFVLFYERPAGKKLSELLAETKSELNEAFLIKNIISPIASAIHALSERDLTHGRINLDNIYYHDGPILGECISEPCGYSQPFFYETLERMQALPAAKGEGTSSQDYYALAVLVLHLLYGAGHFAGWNQEMLIRAILRDGNYTALLRDKEHSGPIEEFFRGLLVLNAKDRWDYTHLQQWGDGKRFNVLVPAIVPEAVRPFEHGNIQANTRRELAHVLYGHWAQLPDILSGIQLVQWISVSLRNKTLSEGVNRINASLKDISTKNSIQAGEQFMRLLMLFDPEGPIRISPLAMHVDGMDSLYAELAQKQSENDLQLMAKFIELNMINYWHASRKEIEQSPTVTVNNLLTKLDRLRISIRNTTLGFGLERILYDLNPEMPCLSPLMANYHVTSLQALLKRLDHLAPRLASGQDPIDRHIAAFVASKLNMQHEIKLHELAALPALSANRSMFALKLLAQAQQRSIDTPLPGLTHWIGVRILPALETLRSRTLRKTLISMLMDRIETGSLPYISEMMIDSNYAVADHDGYGRAVRTYSANTVEIAALRRNEGIEEKSAQLGYSIAKILASAAFVLTLLGVVRLIG